ncbi:uncharacterized protein LOC103282681 isoform X2 [Anolis carolinensis]
MFFVSWTGLLGLALLVSRGEGQSCLPGVQVVPNLARGRPAFQSSTYQHPKSLVAGKAVDGNCNGNLDGAGSCTHTNGDMEPWWYVDLGDEYAIFAVVIKNRGECCGDRIRGAEIHVGDFVAENSKFNPLSPVHTTLHELEWILWLCCRKLSWPGSHCCGMYSGLYGHVPEAFSPDVSPTSVADILRGFDVCAKLGKWGLYICGRSRVGERTLVCGRQV